MRNISKAVRQGPRLARYESALLDILRLFGLRDPTSAACDELCLTAPQVHALLWLGHEGPLTMGELARLCGITEKTITGIVDRLEAAGLVERARDQSDRRVVRVRLTPQGTAGFKMLRAQVAEKIEAALAMLGEPDSEVLLGILERFRDRLGSRGAAQVRQRTKEERRS